MEHYRADFGKLPWISVMPGIRHKIVDRDNRRLRLVEYNKDLEPHWCERGHIGYVLEGKFEIEFDEDVIVYEPGDGVIIPPGPKHKHKGRAVTSVVRIVFVGDTP